MNVLTLTSDRLKAIREDPFEVFLSHGYDAKKYKVLYSSFKRKIPSRFSGTLFNCHIKLIESSDDLDMSQLFFFSPFYNR